MTTETLINGSGLTQPIPLTGEALPSRIELIATGELRMNDARGHVGRITNAAAVIQRSLETANGGVLPIDFDHGTDGLSARGTEAAGWITGLEVEGNRIFASVEWTPPGEAALRGKSYRFISPTFTVNDKTLEVVRILRAALTNNPAFTELKQLASKQESTSMPDWLKNLAEQLGLGKDADEATITAAVTAAVGAAIQARTVVTAAGMTGEMTEAAATAITTKITASGKADPAKYVPIEAVTKLTAQVAELQKKLDGDGTDRLVTAAMEAGKVAPALEDWARDYAATNPEGFAAWVEKAPVLASAKPAVAAAVPAKADGPLTAEEKLVCAATGISEEAFLATKSGKPLAKEKAA